MTIYVELDFETRSLCDLKLAGASRYSEDVTTEVICLVFKTEEAGVEVWTPNEGREDHLFAFVERQDTIFVAHNAAFEQAIWRNQMVAVHGFPPIPIERWDCSLAASAYKGMPLALDKVGRALRLNSEKDKEGNKLTLSMSKLDKKTHMLPEITPTIRRRIIDYCAQDVVVESGVVKRVGLISSMSKHERGIWKYDQTINQRGVRLDLSFVAAAQAIVDKETARLLPEFQALTGIMKLGSPVLKQWLGANGVPVENLQKGTIAALLDTEEDDGDPTFGYESLAGEGDGEDYLGLQPLRLPDGVRRVLEIKQMLGGAAVKKLKRMLACVGYDGRARGLLQYHAAHSGRWGGRLLQPQNFPRDTIKDRRTGKPLDPELAVAAILSGDPATVEKELGLPPLEAVARSLRHALVPGPGKVFLVGDYAQIEARIVLALARQHDKTKLMADGYPVYFDMAEQIYNIDKGHWATTDEAQLKANKEQFLAQYTIGKNTILGCGFQMGPAKFHARYCPEQPIEFAEEVVRVYRQEWAPKVPKVWWALEAASLRAVETATRQEAYGIIFKPDGEWLSMTLPNQWQKIWYYNPHLGQGTFGTPCWKSMQSKQGKWFPVDMYGGLETENAVQGLARGVMCGAIDRLEKAGMPVVLSVHDELICEVDENCVDETRFAALMSEPTVWTEAMGIPIAVETWQGKRYRK